jgi:AmiR/NasT family two-component response regulator
VPNQTLTSNFNGSNLSEVEELRRQLAESSVELEDTKDINMKKIVLQQKQMDEYYE